jgi:hypothetical protein
MVVIGHHNEGVHPPTGPPAHLSQCGQKLLAIGVITENRFPSIATIQQMIDGTGEFDACFPGHELRQITPQLLPCRMLNCRDSKTDPFFPAHPRDFVFIAFLDVTVRQSIAICDFHNGFRSLTVYAYTTAVWDVPSGRNTI